MIDPTSRYRDVPVFNYQTHDGRTVRYVARRFPAPASPQLGVDYRIHAGDRPDLIAARALGDPLAFWRLAEANLLLDPWDLVQMPGHVIHVPSSAVAFQVAG